MVKNADNPPGPGTLEDFCFFSLFFSSMSRSVSFLFFVLVLNGLLGLMGEEVEAKGDWLVGSNNGRVISGIGLEDTSRLLAFRFLDGKAVEFPLCKGVE